MKAIPKGVLVRRSASAGVSAVGACLCVAYFVVPGMAAKDLVYLLVGLASTACVLVGARRLPAPERPGWYLLAAANVSFVLGDGLLDVYGIVLNQAPPFPSIADGLYLAGYPFLFIGVFRVSRLRHTAGSRESAADAAMICVGALALSWQFLMGSYAHDETLGWFGKLVAMAYPVMDLGVLFIVVRAMMSGSGRRISDRLIASSVLAMLIADFGYDLMVLNGSYAVGNPINLPYLLNYVLLAAAALHPSAAQSWPVAAAKGHGRQLWLPLVALAAFVSPAILLLSGVADWRVDVPILAGTSLALSILAVIRGSWLFRRLTEQTVQLLDRGESLRAALATQQALEGDLRHLAFHDSLTGLANRALLQDRVEHALARSARSPGSAVLFFCDLDGFKAVNDSLGHQLGDELLVTAGKRLASIVRAGDTVARLGGDEFAILLDTVDDSELATELAARVVSVLRQPIHIGGQRVYLSASVGVAFAEPGCSAELLLSEADSAMYEAKSSGKNRYTVFEPAMRSRLIDRMALVNAFQGSLERGEFFMEYQPQYRLADGALEGFEALVRWQHPALGRIAPYSFIPVAEETGFIVTMGRWILEMACLEAAAWRRSSELPLTLSVNLSGRQLQDPELVDDVRNALALSRLPADQLVLEVTESMLMHDPDRVTDVLRELKAMGIRIAIDDFGTGYSSLSQLRKFPVDILKIDKSFVDPLRESGGEGAAFIETILRLASDLNLSTVAEGIEHDVQRQTLAELHCDSAQGYLMSRPLSSQHARVLVSKSGHSRQLEPVLATSSQQRDEVA